MIDIVVVVHVRDSCPVDAVLLGEIETVTVIAPGQLQPFPGEFICVERPARFDGFVAIVFEFRIHTLPVE